jgi:hypothetical protein
MRQLGSPFQNSFTTFEILPGSRRTRKRLVNFRIADNSHRTHLSPATTQLAAMKLTLL